MYDNLRITGHDGCESGFAGKELELARVRKEVEALHLLVPSLPDNQDWVEHGAASPPPHSPGTRTTGLSPRLVSDSRSRISAIWHAARSGFRSRTPPAGQEAAV
jgi:hypothetical protein